MAGLLLAAGTHEAPGQETARFGVEVELVRLDVIVLDSEGRPVTGLTREDFVVEDDGEPQEIASFEPVVIRPRPAPQEEPRLSSNRVRSPVEGRTIVIVFDDVHVTPSVSQIVRDALVRFIRDDLRSGDSITILSVGQGLRWSARTSWEHEQMVPFVARLQGRHVRDPTLSGISDWEAMRIGEHGISGLGSPALSDSDLRPGESPIPAGVPADTGGGSSDPRMGVGVRDMSFLSEEISSAAKRRMQASLSGILAALESMVGARGHKSLVVVSEGFTLAPRTSEYRRVVDLARRAQVAIDVLDPRAVESGYGAGEGGASPGELVGMRRMLEQVGSEDVAEVTGGRILGGNDPEVGLRQIAREAEAYYLLGLPADPEGRGMREVEVRVKRPGLTVRARSRYVASRPPEPMQRKDADRAELRSITEASELPLRVGTMFFESDGKGDVTTMFATEIRPPGELQEGRRRFFTVAEAWPRDGGTPLHDQFEEDLDVHPGVPTVLSRHWSMPPGVWQVRIHVRDNQTGLSGTALHTFEVPSPDTFRISTPILTTQLEPREGVPRPRVVLGRTFRTGRMLYCQFQVHGAAVDRKEGWPRVRAGWQLRRGGELVRAGEPTEIQPDRDRSLSRLMGLSLEGAAIGGYDLVLEVEDEISGKKLTATEAFTVAP